MLGFQAPHIDVYAYCGQPQTRVGNPGYFWSWQGLLQNPETNSLAKSLPRTGQSRYAPRGPFTRMQVFPHDDDRPDTDSAATRLAQSLFRSSSVESGLLGSRFKGHLSQSGRGSASTMVVYAHTFLNPYNACHPCSVPPTHPFRNVSSA